MKLPKITVVTPSYNQARFLEATIQSVLNQEYPNLEYIVIDGGSTDGSVEIILRYTQYLTYWVSEPDNGQTDALIKGFARATGDILCWLNSDDLFEPETLKQVAEFFIENPQVHVVYGDSTWINAEGKKLRPKKEHAFNLFIFFYDHVYIPQPSTFFRRDIYEKVEGLNSEIDVAMDADLWIRFAKVTNIHHLRRQWSRMRFHKDAKTHPQRLLKKARMQRQELRRQHYGDEPNWSPKVKKVLAKSMRIGWKLVTGCYW
jgi:glycosyltransferase involved in cell wall biosynthesis